MTTYKGPIITIAIMVSVICIEHHHHHHHHHPNFCDLYHYLLTRVNMKMIKIIIIITIVAFIF